LHVFAFYPRACSHNLTHHPDVPAPCPSGAPQATQPARPRYLDCPVYGHTLDVHLGTPPDTVLVFSAVTGPWSSLTPPPKFPKALRLCKPLTDLQLCKTHSMAPVPVFTSVAPPHAWVPIFTTVLWLSFTPPRHPYPHPSVSTPLALFPHTTKGHCDRALVRPGNPACTWE
jgi:hypothetical protein